MTHSTRPVLIALIVLIALSLGCGLSNVQQAEPTATPTVAPILPLPPTQAPPTVPPSDTPVPDTPTPAPTETPSEVTVTAASGDAACRFGPASEYSVQGKLASGATGLAVARDASSSWVRIPHPTHPRLTCWLKVEQLSVSGNLASVPVEPPPPAIVTNVMVDVAPSEATVPGCAFPYTFSVQFSISVTGPTTVKFQRSKSDGSKAPVETQTFTAFGTYTFTDSMRVGSVGEHWFQVDVSSPNAMSGRGTARANCP